MSADERLAFLKKEYCEGGRSFGDIAKSLGTYTNRLRRDAISFKLPIRDKKEAQTNALKSGRAKHPTEGTKRDDATKVKISEKRSETWQHADEDQKKAASDRAKKQWAEMTPEQKEMFRKKAARAVRMAAKNGSKLERHIHDALIEAGYMVDFHKEQTLMNERLELDMFLPREGVAIEIDGPSHFLPIWGNKTLQKNRRADSEKNGLLLTRGLIVVRVKQDGQLSEKYKRDKTNALLELLASFKTKKPVNRYFEI